MSTQQKPRVITDPHLRPRRQPALPTNVQDLRQTKEYKAASRRLVSPHYLSLFLDSKGGDLIADSRIVLIAEVTG
jgi:hypothetical protein